MAVLIGIFTKISPRKRLGNYVWRYQDRDCRETPSGITPMILPIYERDKGLGYGSNPKREVQDVKFQ